jgi:probable addiction module antidote protein
MSESSENSPFRDNPAEIARYLTEILAKDDFRAILQALSIILRAQNVAALARASGLRRDRLYVTFDGEVEPDFRRVLKLLEGLDVQLVVVPRENPRPKPDLPKLGRPRTSTRRRKPQ